MRWFAELSLEKAIKLALVWPALVVCMLTLASIVLLSKTRDGWGFHYQISSNIPGPGWVAATVAILALLLGPPLLFLAVWRLARR